ncbi:isochorismate synthase [Halapricum hydrolyticum]|uniref:isochorismate synthase n=1 Tax=Halapricum hydrolyticum TaxID=2979991 RepID=A0AAE3LEX7_9EURY|nr:isochorismate synthase [Halapricum hydrolyticum]MCU4717798.1 isochorismate synthase [Halapricum hydrolyticum]MCU4726962.1 isochorismate synthase [Halapricum hydrolyticum]
METLRGDDVGAASELAIVARSRRLDSLSPDALQRVADAPTVVWRGPEESIVAAGATASISADGPDRFETVRETATALFESLQGDGPRPARPRLFGGFAFHDGTGTGTDWDGFPDAWFVLPRVQVTARDGARWLTVTADTPDLAAERLEAWQDRLTGATDAERSGPPGIVDEHRTPSRPDWREQITAALADIRAGRLRKVVLAQSLSVDLAGPVSVPDALSRLDETYPDCYRFAFAPGDGAGTFFGATPETLVSLTDRTVRTGALAGSTGRGETRAEDEWLADELLDSEKDNHEHDLVVEAIREQLDPVAARVTTGERSIRKLATVQHLETPIRAALDADRHVLELVEALHPTPAVGGLPPDVALKTIKSTEAFDRGWYAAPVGWIDAAGDGTFAVAIRSALARERTATLFAGAGIVADSDPDREWDEVQLKYRPMLDELE